MSVSDKKMLNTGKATFKCVTCEVGATATSQTALEVDSFIPGFNFEVVRVEAYCTAITPVATVDVLIGATTVLTGAITPVAGTATAGTLATSKAARRGSSTEAVNVVYTTDGSGAMTKAKVRVWVRPFPLSDEALPTAGL